MTTARGLSRHPQGVATFIGIGGRLASESVAGMDRNHWPLCLGIRSLRASEQDRPDVACRRAQWLRYRHRIDASRLVFIDETWTKTNMAPLRGWARRGQRLKAKAPHRRWKTMTFLAALRHDRLEAPWLIDGPINGERFRLYVEQVLLPTLCPSDIVVMDTWAVTVAKPCGAPSVQSVPSCSFCPNTLPT